MSKTAVTHHPVRTLRKKLFGYMFVLAALLLLTLLMGMILFGQYETTSKKVFDSLDVQMEIFEKDILSHFDSLAAAGISLSEETASIIDDFIESSGTSFPVIEDNDDQILHLEDSLIEPLKQRLTQEDCSGIFVMLDTTINSSLENASLSRAGIWLQVNGYEQGHQNVLMYRGLSSLARPHDIMPHRKWHMEFKTDLFPDYEKLLSMKELSASEAYYFTKVTVLPGTSERVMLLTVPVKGAEGTFYGFCGFEVSSSFFQTFHAQPSKIQRLTCLLAPSDGETVYSNLGFTCGTTDGYYCDLPYDFVLKNSDDNLVHLAAENAEYIGVTRDVRLSPVNDNYKLAVMICKDDFDISSRNNTFHNLTLALLLIFFTVTCCLFFSRQFLLPVLRELDSLKHQCESAQSEITRLAYSRKKEIDPDNYQQFISGIQTLTPTERKIFSYYLDGKTVKEVIALSCIKESTLRYHNQNIYSKLGVNSLKQLVLYGTVMRQQEKNIDK